MPCYDHIEYVEPRPGFVQVLASVGGNHYYGNGRSKEDALRNMEKSIALLKLKQRVGKFRSSEEEVHAGDVLELLSELVECLT
jgi:hypothetical protein